MAESEYEVPEGAAVFPTIPPELGINPLLLAVLHAIVFLAGSDPELVNPDAGHEALESMASYLHRLTPEEIQHLREDMACLETHARQQKWPRQMIHAIQSLLDDLGIGGQGPS